MEKFGTHAGNATPLQCHPSGIQPGRSPFWVSEYQVLLPFDAPRSIFYARLTLDFRGVFGTKGKRDVNENHCRSLYGSPFSTGGGLKRYRKHEKFPVCSTELLLHGRLLLKSAESFKVHERSSKKPSTMFFLHGFVSNCREN